MAYRCQRLLLQCYTRCTKVRLLDPSKLQPACGSGAVQTASLTSIQSHGNEIKRAQAFPYEDIPYGPLDQFFDHTRKRFNDNSKVIVVEGNLATGKSDFAQKIAKEFDLKFFPDYVDEGIFQTESGFDVRELNEQLPPGARCLDLATFHTQSEHPELLKKIGRTQLAIYKRRFFVYILALEHLFNTGQGVIIERSPWSDVVFADTLRKHGYMTSKALNYYNDWRGNSICELWKPHLVLYMDAPLSVVRQRINARNDPSETKGKVVTDDYIKTIDDVYKKKVLPYYRKYCTVMNFDITDMPDWEITVEDLEYLNLDSHTDDNEHLFEDWMKVREDDWNHYRLLLSSKWQLENLFKLPVPWEAPEMMISGEDFQEYLKIVDKHPEVRYAAGFNPELLFSFGRSKNAS